MFALIQFSDAFYLVVPKHCFHSAYMLPPDISPSFTSHPKTLTKLIKPRISKWDFQTLRRQLNVVKHCLLDCLIYLLI